VVSDRKFDQVGTIVFGRSKNEKFPVPIEVIDKKKKKTEFLIKTSF